MTTPDYLINALFVFVVLRQARERHVDLRSLLVPLAVAFFIGQRFLHTIPTGGSDLLFVGLLTALGLTLGLACGFATHVRVTRDGVPVARVGWLAGGLLIAGICGRMAFAAALSHGAEPAIRSFSIAHHLSAAAWPTGLVLMALCEVGARVVTVHVRAARLIGGGGGQLPAGVGA